MRDLVLNFVSWGMGDLWMVGIVCCVVSKSFVVVVDWLNVN